MDYVGPIPEARQRLDIVDCMVLPSDVHVPQGFVNRARVTMLPYTFEPGPKAGYYLIKMSGASRFVVESRKEEEEQNPADIADDDFDLGVDDFEEVTEPTLSMFDADVAVESQQSKVKSSVARYAKKSGFEFSKMKASWDDIYLMVIQNLVANKYSWQATSVPVRRASSASSASCRSSATLRSTNETSSSVSTEVSVKQIKLTEEDKSKIKTMYASLEKEKMWKLSTGTFVEEKMMEHAIKQEYEHLSHSLIFHIEDRCWADYFTAAEIDEIKSVNTVELPSLPDTVKAYLDQLKATPKTTLYDILNAETFPIESDQKWIQDAFNACLHWQENVVLCVSGEKCSKASADAANNDRCLSAIGRQSCGRKMDYIFMDKQTEMTELGCGECALVGGVKTTKELVDAQYKMPKVMRDMANSIIFKKSGLRHDLCMVGYYIGGSTMQLFTLDFPAGYVARLDGYGPADYPASEDQICSMLPAVLELVLKGRWLMEATKKKIEGYRGVKPMARLGVVPDHIVPTFVPMNKKSQKRKLNNE